MKRCELCWTDFEPRNAKQRYCSKHCTRLGRHIPHVDPLLGLLLKAGPLGLTKQEIADLLGCTEFEVGWIIRAARIMLGDVNGEVIISRSYHYSIAENANEATAWGMHLAEDRRRQLLNVVTYIGHIKHHFSDRKTRQKLEAIELQLRAAEAVFASVDFEHMQ